MNKQTQTAPTEELLRVVADPRRRVILHYLHETDGETVAVEDLIRAIETDGTRDGVDGPADHARIRIELQHQHLPQLAEAGIIDYDRETDRVRHAPQDRVRALLDFVSTRLD